MGKYLLDTHVFLWFLTGEQSKFSAKTLEILNNQNNQLYFSTASIWELSIKSALNKVDFDYDPFVVSDELIRLGFIELSIVLAHVLAVSKLPLIHGDPFDRLLITQSKIENITLLTADKHILQYDTDFSQDVR